MVLVSRLQVGRWTHLTALRYPMSEGAWDVYPVICVMCDSFHRMFSHTMALRHILLQIPNCSIRLVSLRVTIVFGMSEGSLQSVHSIND